MFAPQSDLYRQIYGAQPPQQQQQQPTGASPAFVRDGLQRAVSHQQGGPAPPIAVTMQPPVLPGQMPVAAYHPHLQPSQMAAAQMHQAAMQHAQAHAAAAAQQHMGVATRSGSQLPPIHPPGRGHGAGVRAGASMGRPGKAAAGTETPEDSDSSGDDGLDARYGNTAGMSKVERRRARERESARRSRRRKKEQLENLEGTVRSLAEENDRLRRRAAYRDLLKLQDTHAREIKALEKLLSEEPIDEATTRRGVEAIRETDRARRMAIRTLLHDLVQILQPVYKTEAMLWFVEHIGRFDPADDAEPFATAGGASSSQQASGASTPPLGAQGRARGASPCSSAASSATPAGAPPRQARRPADPGPPARPRCALRRGRAGPGRAQQPALAAGEQPRVALGRRAPLPLAPLRAEGEEGGPALRGSRGQGQGQQQPQQEGAEAGLTASDAAALSRGIVRSVVRAMGISRLQHMQAHLWMNTHREAIERSRGLHREMKAITFRLQQLRQDYENEWRDLHEALHLLWLGVFCLETPAAPAPPPCSSSSSFSFFFFFVPAPSRNPPRMRRRPRHAAAAPPTPPGTQGLAEEAVTTPKQDGQFILFAEQYTAAILQQIGAPAMPPPQPPPHSRLRAADRERGGAGERERPPAQPSKPSPAKELRGAREGREGEEPPAPAPRTRGGRRASPAPPAPPAPGDVEEAPAGPPAPSGGIPSIPEMMAHLKDII
eukprot:tig00001286_g8027.t1